MNCQDFDRDLTLFRYGELSPAEREALEAHVAACPACRANLEAYDKLHKLLAQREPAEPTPQMLAECRMMLEDALDRDLANYSWKKVLSDWWAGVSAITPVRAATALTLIVFGFGLGWSLRPRSPLAPESAPPAGTATAASTFADPSNLRINAITQVAPAPNSGVRITMDAERRMTLEGSLDDPHIRQILVDAVKGYSNPGIRRDSLDALREGSSHPSVREALLYAMDNDPNPGVRLEAIQTARGMSWSEDVQEALVRALDLRNNPGVRVAAIDALAEHADRASLPLFEKLAASDPSAYVRLKSVSAIRRLEGE